MISSCVINLSTDKGKVLKEVARVLRPGGRFAVSDVVADPDIDEATRQDLQQWTGCIAGALTTDHYRSLLKEAGLGSVEIEETTGCTPTPALRSSEHSSLRILISRFAIRRSWHHLD